MIAFVLVFMLDETGVTWRKPTCPTWWPHDHLTCRRWVSNLGGSSERL